MIALNNHKNLGGLVNAKAKSFFFIKSILLAKIVPNIS